MILRVRGHKKGEISAKFGRRWKGVIVAGLANRNYLITFHPHCDSVCISSFDCVLTYSCVCRPRSEGCTGKTILSLYGPIKHGTKSK